MTGPMKALELFLVMWVQLVAAIGLCVLAPFALAHLIGQRMKKPARR